MNGKSDFASDPSDGHICDGNRGHCAQDCPDARPEHPKDCLGCGGKGFWYSPDNGQTVTCLQYTPRLKPIVSDAQLETDRDIMRKVIDDLAFTLTKLCPFNAACIEIYPGVEAAAVVKLKSIEGQVQHYTATEFSRMAVAITSVFRELEPPSRKQD